MFLLFIDKHAVLYFTEFEVFLLDLKSKWEAKLQKVESKILELDALSDQLTAALEQPKQKSKGLVEPSR